MKATMTFRGIDDYLLSLEKADKDINQISREALAEAGSVLQSEMLANVPFKTGNLRDHIKIKTPSTEGNHNYVEVGVIHDAAFTDRETFIQAIVVEYGSVHMAPRPFIRRSVRKKRKTVNEIIKSHLQAANLVD